MIVATIPSHGMLILARSSLAFEIFFSVVLIIPLPFYRSPGFWHNNSLPDIEQGCIWPAERDLSVK